MEKIKSLLSFCLVLISFGVNAQTNWKFQDVNFSYTVKTDTLLLGETSNKYGKTVKKIEICKLVETTKIQTILPDEFIFESYLDSNIVFIIEDVNFDGFNDFRLLRYTSANLQVQYSYWIYNPLTEQFISDSKLENFFNPYFDQKKKTIHTHWRLGFNEFGHAIHSWVNHELILVAEQIESWGIEEGIPGILMTKHLVNGAFLEEEKEINESNITPHDKCELQKDKKHSKHQLKRQ
jgi:hypothetical protein